MTSNERDLLQTLRGKIEERVPLRSLVLFGSRARGDADPDSDMDVLVVVDGPLDAETDRYVSHCAWQVGLERGIVVVPVAYSRHDWEEGPERLSLLAMAVRREGIPV